MALFSKFRKNKKGKTVEMILDHDGKNWTVSNDSITLAAPSLDSLDRKVERALEEELKQGQSINVFMSFNNEVIPMWIRPYMNHYFNRILELPLQYQS
ncbi:MAG: hypothetical protein GXP56_05880 [Deltaproteobacteria bacterium]|nr:hypothetical protein [Deltaproteobacteria bacterium]